MEWTETNSTGPKIVQERFARSPITVTMDQYSHAVPEVQDEAAEKLDRVLGTPYRLKHIGNMGFKG